MREPRPVPQLLAGRRRWLFAGLAANGGAQAAAALGCAWEVHRIFDRIVEVRAGTAAGALDLFALVGVLVAAGLALAALRASERVQAERLGQHYAAELRLALFDGMAAQSPRACRGAAAARPCCASSATCGGYGAGSASVCRASRSAR